MPLSIQLGWSTFRRKKLSKTEEEARRQRAGFTPAKCLKHLATAMPIPRTMNHNQYKRFKRICRLFEAYVKPRGGLLIGNTLCATFPHSMAPHLPRWTNQQLDGFVFFYVVALKSSSKDGSKGLKVVQNFISAISFHQRRTRGVGLGRDVTDKCVSFLQRKKDLLKLREGTGPRAELTLKSVQAMVLSTSTKSLRWAMRQRLDASLYIATGISTGNRGCSMLRYGSEVINTSSTEARKHLLSDVVESYTFEHDTEFKRRLNDLTTLTGSEASQLKLKTRGDGITWASYKFWRTEDGPLVWMQSQDRKTEESEGKWYALKAGPSIGLSASHLSITAAWLDGVFGEAEFAELFRPTKKGEPSIQLETDPAKLNTLVLMARGTGWNRRKANEILGDLSILNGFQLKVKSHDFRHLVCQAVYMNMSMEWGMMQLGHLTRRGVLAYYGKGATTGYFSGNMVSIFDNNSAIKRSAVVDTECPSYLSPEEVLEVKQDEECKWIVLSKLKSTVKRWHQKQAEVKSKIVAEYATLAAAPKQTQLAYGKIGNDWAFRFRKLAGEKLEAKRQAYILNKRQGLPASSDTLVKDGNAAVIPGVQVATSNSTDSEDDSPVDIDLVTTIIDTVAEVQGETVVVEQKSFGFTRERDDDFLAFLMAKPQDIGDFAEYVQSLASRKRTPAPSKPFKQRQRTTMK